MQKARDSGTQTKSETRPAVSVVLSGALVALFPGATTHLEMNASSVEDLLGKLDERWPGMRDRVRDERPSIRKHMNIFVDGRRGALDTPLKTGSKVYVLTAMSGG